MGNRAERGFLRGHNAVFVCKCCGRNTRITTQIVTDPETCGECEELMGEQNAVWDGTIDMANPDDRVHRDALMAKIVKLGGDADKVKAYVHLPDLFKDEKA